MIVFLSYDYDNKIYFHNWFSSNILVVFIGKTGIILLTFKKSLSKIIKNTLLLMTSINIQGVRYVKYSLKHIEFIFFHLE